MTSFGLTRSLALCLIYSCFLLQAQNCEVSSLYGWASMNGGTTGGETGESVIVTTMASLNTEAKKPEKRTIYVQGALVGQADIKSDKTVFGLPGASIKGNIRISGAHNVIVRNLIVRGDTCTTYEGCKSGNDAVNIGNRSTNIWLDHLDIANGQDGNCDVVSASDFVTISYCKFSYTYDKWHRFSNLIGSDDSIPSDEGKLNVTYHHNWWADKIVERQPRARYGKIHVANNLYTSTTTSYLVGPGFKSNVLVEGNVMNTTKAAIKVYPGYEAVLGRNNLGPASANQALFTVFVPPYSMPIDVADLTLENHLRQCAGATLADPITAGLYEEQEELVKVMSPQPFSDELRVEVPNGCTYQLMDVRGNVIFQEQQSKVLQTSALASGMYLLRIQKGGRVQTKKIFKS